MRAGYPPSVGPSSNRWILYSAIVLIVGVVLAVATGGHAGLILAAGGAVGIAIRASRLIR